MKRMEPKKTVEIEGVVFYIYPFRAFEASNLFAELASFATPIIGALVPAAASVEVGSGKGDLREKALAAVKGMSDEEAIAKIGAGLANLKVSGNSLEHLLRRLLVQKENVTAEYRDEHGKTVQSVLDDDLADEFFCDNLPGMFTLAAAVIQANYGDFFSKIAAQFGSPQDGEEETTSENTAPLT